MAGKTYFSNCDCAERLSKSLREQFWKALASPAEVPHMVENPKAR